VSTPAPPPPPQVWGPSGQAPASGRPAWLLPVVGGCGCLVLLGILAIAALAWFGFALEEEGKHVVVRVEIPAEVRMGESTDLVVHVANKKNDEALTVDSIDLPMELLDAFIVVSTDPVPGSTQSVMGDMLYEFETDVMPGQTRAFRWTLQPKTTGPHGFELDISGPMYLQSVYFSTTVVGADGAP
jgi:hypothetical protein